MLRWPVSLYVRLFRLVYARRFQHFGRGYISYCLAAKPREYINL